MYNYIEKYLFLFIVLLVASCNKKELNELRNQNLEANSISEFKSMMINNSNEDNLVSKIDEAGDLYIFLLEDSTKISFTKSFIQKINYDSTNWKCNVKFSAIDSIKLLARGNKINDLKVIDPTLDNPLVSFFSAEVPYRGKINYIVLGQDGALSNIESGLTDIANTFTSSIIGLYFDYNNRVEINYYNKKGFLRYKSLINIQTLKNNRFTGDLKIVVPNAAPQKNELYLFTMRQNGYHYLVDNFGKFRWITSIAFLGGSTYALKPLRNGNIAFVSNNESKIYEGDLSGRNIKTYSLPSIYKNSTHDFLELNNGNFITTVSKVGLKTTYDHLVLIDRNTSNVLKEWNLNLSIPKRYDLIKDTVDWLHPNALSFDLADSSMFVSGQRSGVFKISWDNKLKWILAHPKGFEKYSNLVLTGVNEDLNWGQHNVQYLGNDMIALFDNGFGRNFSGTQKYSRGIIYKINEQGKNFTKIWEFGKDYPQYFSSIISGLQINSDDSKLLCFGSPGYDFTYTDSTRYTIVQKPATGQKYLTASFIKVNSNNQVSFLLEIHSDQSTGVYRATKVEIFKDIF